MQLLKPFCLWLTGLPSSGKTTTATALKNHLLNEGITTIHLDGDNVRKGLNSDLGLSKADREENNRRIIHVAQIVVDGGVPVISSFISPYQSTRDFARKIIPNYHEVFVDAPLEVCVSRDVKGLYAKAKAGQISDLTGFNAPYEIPNQPDFHLFTSETDLQTGVSHLLQFLQRKKYLKNEK